MESVAVASGRPQEISSSATVGEGVLRCIETNARRESLAPKIVYSVVFGLPLLLSFFENGLGIETIVKGVIAFFGAKTGNVSRP